MNLESLSTHQLEHIAELGDPFEASWRAGRRPRLKDILTGVNAPERPALLGVLLAQEWEVRLRLGESPTIQEYRDRFPVHDEAIFDAVQSLILAHDNPVWAVGDGRWGAHRSASIASRPAAGLPADQQPHRAVPGSSNTTPRAGWAKSSSPMTESSTVTSP